MDGIEVLENIKQNSDTPVIMISGHGTIETAVEAIKKVLSTISPSRRISTGYLSHYVTHLTNPNS